MNAEQWNMAILPVCPRCLLACMSSSEMWAGSMEAGLRWKRTLDQPESEHLDSEALSDNSIAWKHSVTVGLIAKTRSVLLDYLDHLSGWTHSLKGGPPLGSQRLLPVGSREGEVGVGSHSCSRLASPLSLLTLPKEFRLVPTCRSIYLHCLFSAETFGVPMSTGSAQTWQIFVQSICSKSHLAYPEKRSYFSD